MCKWERLSRVECVKTTAQSEGGWLEVWRYGPVVVEWHTDDAPDYAPIEGYASISLCGRSVVFARDSWGTWPEVKRRIESYIEETRALLAKISA